jgi:hypothetical protein
MLKDLQFECITTNLHFEHNSTIKLQIQSEIQKSETLNPFDFKIIM